MITALIINAALAAIALIAVVTLIVRAIRAAHTPAAGAPVRIVTFNTSTARERQGLAEAA